MAGQYLLMVCVLGISLLLGQACSGRIRRMVGGQPIAKGSWPFLVSLHFLKPHPFLELQGLDHICGGSLIHPYWVLTVAHCFSPLLGEGLDVPSNWIAVVGEYDRRVRERSEQRLPVESIFPGPRFRVHPKLTGDIALLKLRRPARLNNYVKTIDLNPMLIVFDGSECDTAGWGQHVEADHADPQFGNGTMLPHSVTLKKLSMGTCERHFNSTIMRVDHGVMCFASDEGHDACLHYSLGNEYSTHRTDEIQSDRLFRIFQDKDNASYTRGTSEFKGDSGGPLVCKDHTGTPYLTGLVSAGLGCGRPDTSGLYTALLKDFIWIRFTIEIG